MSFPAPKISTKFEFNGYEVILSVHHLSPFSRLLLAAMVRFLSSQRPVRNARYLGPSSRPRRRREIDCHIEHPAAVVEASSACKVSMSLAPASAVVPLRGGGAAYSKHSVEPFHK